MNLDFNMQILILTWNWVNLTDNNNSVIVINSICHLIIIYYLSGIVWSALHV